VNHPRILCIGKEAGARESCKPDTSPGLVYRRSVQGVGNVRAFYSPWDLSSTVLRKRHVMQSDPMIPCPDVPGAEQPLDMLLFQFAKAGKFSRLILSKEPGNVLLRVPYKWAIGYDWVSLGLSRI
jgi:hypothetical protein